jgi:hypothetical protein
VLLVRCEFRLWAETRRIQEGAFDEAVKGVDAIAHTASPCRLTADDPQGMNYHLICFLLLMCIAELIAPALRGTLSILQSALKHGYVVQKPHLFNHIPMHAP